MKIPARIQLILLLACVTGAVIYLLHQLKEIGDLESRRLQLLEEKQAFETRVAQSAD